MTNRALAIFFFALGALLITSCTSTKHLDYFQDLPTTKTVNLPALTQDERVVEIGDDIYIGFVAKDNAAASYFNKSAVTQATTSEASSADAGGAVGLNYLVDANGFVEFSQIGKVKVAGLTARQLKETLTRMVADKLKDPIVEVRFNTFRISVIGDVRSPGTYTLPMQRPTLFQALAAAGDLNITAKRFDIQLYRDYNGQRKITHFDLRKQEVLNNPEVFLIKHNDVLIVKPRTGTFVRENINVIGSVAGLTIGLATLALTIANN